MGLSQLCLTIKYYGILLWIMLSLALRYSSGSVTLLIGGLMGHPGRRAAGEPALRPLYGRRLTAPPVEGA